MVHPIALVDLLAVIAHPDDEIATFGALIPLALARGRRVAVACLTRSPDLVMAAVRADELRACLRTCGITEEPIFAPFPDCGFLGPGRFESLDWVWERWGGRAAAAEYVTDLYRRLRPQVVLAHHPETGEYGHPNHMAAGWACADAWDRLHGDGDEATPCKIYVRSKDDGAWRPDWDAPEAAFDGRSPAEVGAEGLRCHRSQNAATAGVRPWLRYALLRSRVGDDRERNDLFEHCPPRSQPCASPSSSC